MEMKWSLISILGAHKQSLCLLYIFKTLNLYDKIIRWQKSIGLLVTAYVVHTYLMHTYAMKEISPYVLSVYNKKIPS